MTVTVLDTHRLRYTYGDVVTEVYYPLPMKHRYTKSQQALVDAVTQLGWTLDTTAVRIDCWGRFDRMEEDRRVQSLQQHPFVFVRPAADGGWWELELDYVSRDYGYSSSSSRSFNKALLGAKLKRFTAEADQVEFESALSGYPSYPEGAAILQRQSTAGYASTNWVTAVASDNGRETLRAQVLALATDPETVLWLAAERMHNETLALLAARQAYQEAQEARRRPLPEGWDELKTAARAVAKADGLTDLEAVTTALKAALAAVEGTVVVH